MALGSLWARIRGRSSLKPSLLTRLRGRYPAATKTTLNLMGFATWIPVIAFLNIHVAELTVVNGASMYPFLNEDKDSSLTRDLLLTYKWAPQENIQRGMVVTLRSPFHPESVAVKRVTALEGDVVQTRPPSLTPTVRVPDGHVWVEGDGAPGSTLDSNTYGPISKRLLTGKVTHVLYPPRKFGRVKWWEHKRSPET